MELGPHGIRVNAVTPGSSTTATARGSDSSRRRSRSRPTGALCHSTKSAPRRTSPTPSPTCACPLRRSRRVRS
ncbi:hypothetical protein [Pseudonocardia thermophila]|uniref:hypothetical protein n=1 Tax=Pseudonocardia thermophila TaxID=1848 RepID=UPI002286CCCA|nr:hypothetical protein [Pseudonocardia thermophila]